MRGVMAQNARFRHHAAQFAPIFIFLSAFEKSQCPLSNEPKVLQICQEMAELLGKTCEILSDLVNIYRLPSLSVSQCVFSSGVTKFVWYKWYNYYYILYSDSVITFYVILIDVGENE